MERFSQRQSIVIFAVLALILVPNVFGQNKAPEWFTKLKQIKVMESTREDVEKLFSSPEIEGVRKGGGSQIVDYNLGFGRLSVSYSLGKCSENKKALFDVGNNVVIHVYLFFFEIVKASKLKLDLKDFSEYRVYDTDAWEYNNVELGIQYTLGGKKVISSIRFSPADKHDYLYCQKDPK